MERKKMSSQKFIHNPVKGHVEIAPGHEKDKKTQCEIILGLPGDTKQRHYESLRFGLDNNVNSLRMHQAMLLIGTEMASKTARKAVMNHIIASRLTVMIDKLYHRKTWATLLPCPKILLQLEQIEHIRVARFALNAIS